MERRVFPVAIRTQCPKCNATMGLFFRDYELGKRVTMVCANCGAEYYVAFNLSSIPTENQIPDVFIEAWNKEG